MFTIPLLKALDHKTWDDVEKWLVEQIQHIDTIPDDSFKIEIAVSSDGEPITGKKDKPRLAEIFGVEVGEPFIIDGYDGQLSINKNGTFNVLSGDGKNASARILMAVEKPSTVHKVPKKKLTDAETTICHGLGAKWVTKLNVKGITTVQLWRDDPKWNNGQPMGNATPIATIKDEAFPSVKLGDCIEVGE